MTLPINSIEDGYLGALGRKTNGEHFVRTQLDLFQTLTGIQTMPVFFEVSNVPKEVETTILARIANSREFVASVFCSGNNSAIFRLYLNGNLIGKQHTWFTSFNATFPLALLVLNIGDEIIVTVEHFREHVGNFNSTINLVTQ